MENKIFEMPEAEVILFENEDVVTASPYVAPSENMLPFIKYEDPTSNY